MNGEQREQTSVKIRKRGFDNLYNCLVNANLPTVEPIGIYYILFCRKPLHEDISSVKYQ